MKWTWIFKWLVSFFLTFSMTLAPLCGLIPGGINGNFENWTQAQPFTADYAVRLEKDPDKDFVVLNLTDVQMGDSDTFGDAGALAKATIDKLVDETKPDLITLTGDNGGAFLAYNELIRLLDGYGIPWAPVMGNHDGDNGARLSEYWCAYRFSKAKNCVFRFGPKDMGFGNYIIQVCEGDKIVHTLYMMDTHSDLDGGANINGPKEGGYDHLWENQLKWYAWAVNGTNALAGRTVESSVMFHIPVCEYNDAWNMATEDGAIKPEYADSCFGEKNEPVCCPPENNGFFDLMLQLGSTKNVVVGHDHTNTYSIPYKGIRLSYSLKTGMGAYWKETLNGGSTLTIDASGHAAFAHHFVDAGAYITAE